MRKPLLPPEEAIYGHWRSITGQINEFYLAYLNRFVYFNEDLLDFKGARRLYFRWLDLRDWLMTIDQQNRIDRAIYIEHHRKHKCLTCPSRNPPADASQDGCNVTDEEIEQCLDRESDRHWADAAFPIEHDDDVEFEAHCEHMRNIGEPGYE